MLRALRHWVRRWFRGRRGSAVVVESDGDTAESAATRSGRRTVGY
jgi:hypothetical protein